MTSHSVPRLNLNNKVFKGNSTERQQENIQSLFFIIVTHFTFLLFALYWLSRLYSNKRKLLHQTLHLTLIAE